MHIPPRTTRWKTYRKFSSDYDLFTCLQVDNISHPRLASTGERRFANKL